MKVFPHIVLAAVLTTASSPLLAQEAAEAPDSAKAEAKPDPGPLRTIQFEVDEGTWMFLDVSPDGSTILFDLLGDLHTVPIDGGDAPVLLGGRDWDQMPRYSPDGDRIAFISDRDGMMNLWTVDADGSDPKQYSKARTDPHLSPFWTPDGQIIVRKEGELWLYYPEGGSGFKIEIEGSIQGPAISPDGRYLFYSTSATGAGGPPSSSLQRFDRMTAETIPLGSGVRPQISPDGRLMAYARRQDHLVALRVRDLVTGTDRQLVSSITPISRRGSQDVLPGYAFTPDGSSVVITIDGKIKRVDVQSGDVRDIPFRARVSQEVAEQILTPMRQPDEDLEVNVLRYPSISPDGARMVFSALGKLYTTDLPDGTPQRLTDADEREYMPSFSPDGRSIAYATWTDTAYGHVKVIPASGGTTRTLSVHPGRYASPTWSNDGMKIAFARGGQGGVELLGDEPHDQDYFEFFWVPSEGGDPQLITTMIPSRLRGFPMRYYPVIAFNPDGTRLFFSQWERGTSPEQPSQTTLYSVRLDGFDKKGHLKFNAFDEVLPSPDGRRVAYVRRAQVWVSDLPQYPTQVVNLNFESPSIPLKQLTKQGGNYVGWLGNNTVTWLFTNRLYRQDVDADSAEQVAEVRLTVPRARPEGRIAFTNARIITMRGDEVIEDGTIVVDRNRIVAVGRNVQVPSDAVVVDASGKTIMPGLIDSHAHLHYSSFELFPQQKWEYIANLAYGVTTTFDPSAHNIDVFSQSEMVEAGEMLGPRIYSTGDVIYGTESNFPVVYENIKGIDAARDVVKRYKAYNPAMLKEYMQLRRDERQWIKQAAREEGVRLTSEGGGDLVRDLTLALDGYTAVEHTLPLTPLHDDVIELVARTGLHYTPTLIVAYLGSNVIQYFEEFENIHEDPKIRRFTPEGNVDASRYWRHVPEEELDFIAGAADGRKVVERGGYVTVGAHGNRQGLGMQWELWSFVMGGFTPLEAIRAATWHGAVKIGYERDLGSLEPGKLADFLVLNDNPLEEIRNTGKIWYVVKNGFVRDGESMTQVWPGRKALHRFHWQTEEEMRRWSAPAPEALRR